MLRNIHIVALSLFALFATACGEGYDDEQEAFLTGEAALEYRAQQAELANVEIRDVDEEAERRTIEAEPLGGESARYIGTIWTCSCDGVKQRNFCVTGSWQAEAKCKRYYGCDEVEDTKAKCIKP